MVDLFRAGLSLLAPPAFTPLVKDPAAENLAGMLFALAVLGAGALIWYGAYVRRHRPQALVRLARELGWRCRPAAARAP